MKVYALVIKLGYHYMATEVVATYSTKELAEWALNATTELGTDAHLKEIDLDPPVPEDIEKLLREKNIDIPKELIK